MRIRNILLAVSLLLIAAIGYYVFFVQQTARKTVSVHLPALKVAQQFADPVNVVKWYMPYANIGLRAQIQYKDTSNVISTGNDSIEIVNQSMYSTLLRSFSGTKKKEFLFLIMPDLGPREETVVTMTYKTTLFRKWFNKGSLEKNALLSFINFKEYTEDTKRFYGYEIHPVTVTDTLFLFISETVASSEKRNGTRRLFEQLIAFAEQKNAGYNGVRIFHSQKSGDEVTLFASIGVTNRVNISPSDPFVYKLMPVGKNLLEASYQGPFGEAHKAYRALESFKIDHSLSSMAIPFQKFLSDGYDFADDQTVQMKVYYPIF